MATLGFTPSPPLNPQNGVSPLVAARRDPSFHDPFTRVQPLVSICVATSNRCRLLVERCVSSLRRQTYQNLQIVVVGDHCTDDTERRLAALNDDRVTFENLPYRGPYPRRGRARWYVAGTHAMNRALELAEGDFVCHLDDDDESVATRVERLVGVAQESRAELVWHRFSYERGDGVWVTLGTHELGISTVTSGSFFYHRVLRMVPWDVFAYRYDEPGDWNRVRRILQLQPTSRFVRDVLTLHYRERGQRVYVPLPGERFLEE